MKTLVLAGSGEFTPSMIETDKYLISISKFKDQISKFKIVIISAASVPDGKQRFWINKGVKHFNKLGVRAFGVNIENRKDANKKENLEKIKTANFVYFSGGHPGFLFDTLKDTIAWKLIIKLYEKGVILTGSSAGAMIMGKFLLSNAQESFDQGAKPIWTKGFNLLPYTILPHYDWAVTNRAKDLKRVMDSAPEKIKNSWLGIDEDTVFVLNDDNKAKVLGAGTVTVFSKAIITVYKTGHNLLI